MVFKKYKKLLAILLFFANFYFFSFAFAQEKGILWQNISSDCLANGNCQLNDMLRLGVNIANLILKYMGVVALVLFIYGGVLWITSGGSQAQIKKGKQIIIGALVGIIFIVSAYLIVTAVMKALGVEEEYFPKSQASFIINNFLFL